MNTFKKSEFESYLIVDCHLSKLTVAAYSGDVYFCQTLQGSVPTKQNVLLNQLSANEYTKRSVARKVSSLRLYFYFLKNKHHQEVPEIGNIFQTNPSLNLPKLIRKSHLRASDQL